MFTTVLSVAPERPAVEDATAESILRSSHPLLTAWINGLAHHEPAFPHIDNADVELFQAIDLSGTRQAHDQRLSYFAIEQTLREIALVVVEESGLHEYTKKVRSLQPLTSPESALKALDVCFAVPQSPWLQPIDRCTLIMGTVTCAISALPTENWFYAMSNAGTSASIYIKTARNHAHALTQIYQSFANLVAFARTPEARIPL